MSALLITLSPKIHSDTRFLMLSLSARGLWITCLSWCIPNNTDGLVDRGVVASFQGCLHYDSDTDAVNELLLYGFFKHVEGGHFAIQTDGFAEVIDGPNDSWAFARNLIAPIVYQRDGHKCVYCRSVEDLSIDHVMPQSRGGSHDISNLATCCRSCNSSKGDKTPEEWKGAQSK